MSEDTFERVVSLAAHLPETERSTSYGTPALKVRGKGFVRMKEKMTNILVVMKPLELIQRRDCAWIEKVPKKLIRQEFSEVP